MFDRATFFAGSFCILVVVVLLGCQSAVVSAGDDPKFSARMDSVAKKISVDLAATWYTFHSFRDHDSTTTNYIELEFHGISANLDSNAAYQAISYSVYWTFDALPDSVRNSYTQYYVTLKTNSKTYKDTVYLGEVSWAHLMSIIVHGAFSESDSCNTCFDPRYYPNNFTDTLFNMYRKELPGEGEMEFLINGFYPFAINGDEYAIGYWITANRGGHKRRFIVIVSSESSRIVALNMLEETR